MLKLHFYNHKTLRHLKKQSFYHCCKCCLCKAYSPDTFQTHLVYWKMIWEMIRTVGVRQVKYCYRMNINSVQIQFIQYAFNLNILQAEDASKMTCKSHESHPGAFSTIPSIVSSSVPPNFYNVLLRPCSQSTYPQIPKLRGFKSGEEESHSSLEMKLGTLADSHSCVFLALCDGAKSC